MRTSLTLSTRQCQSYLAFLTSNRPVNLIHLRRDTLQALIFLATSGELVVRDITAKYSSVKPLKNERLCPNKYH